MNVLIKSTISLSLCVVVTVNCFYTFGNFVFNEKMLKLKLHNVHWTPTVMKNFDTSSITYFILKILNDWFICFLSLTALVSLLGLYIVVYFLLLFLKRK